MFSIVGTTAVVLCPVPGCDQMDDCLAGASEQFGLHYYMPYYSF